LFQGVTVCAGVALGRVRIGGNELDRPTEARIPVSQTEAEVQRFHDAVRRSFEQVRELSQSLKGDLGHEESRILDVHLAYLEDSTFLNDVEARIRQDQLPLEAALSRVVRDFDRIFELVENEKLKEKALDLRDVALRVVRNVEAQDQQHDLREHQEPYVLATHKLSIADMFTIDNEQVLGVIAEEGGLNSHAGILARSMGIPTLTGVSDLRERLREGDFVILDSSTGVVHVNPDDKLVRKYEIAAGESRAHVESGELGTVALTDGTELTVYGSCGSFGDVSHAMAMGLEGVGLYRTELLFLVARAIPDEETLLNHYREVIKRAGGKRVCFRLFDDEGDLHLPGLRTGTEPNPALGLKGVRLLLAEQTILRQQLRVLMRLAPDSVVDIVVPFVTSLSDLQRVRELIREERAALLKDEIACSEVVRLGVLVEVPATAFHLAHVADEADFLIVALDDLQQYLLAADRDNLDVANYYRAFHPALFKLLEQIVEDARSLGKAGELYLFGESAADPLRLPFYVGVGIRKFSVSPGRAAKIAETMSRWSLPETKELARSVLNAGTAPKVQKLLLAAKDPVVEA